MVDNADDAIKQEAVAVPAAETCDTQAFHLLLAATRADDGVATAALQVFYSSSC